MAGITPASTMTSTGFRLSHRCTPRRALAVTIYRIKQSKRRQRTTSDALERTRQLAGQVRQDTTRPSGRHTWPALKEAEQAGSRGGVADRRKHLLPSPPPQHDQKQNATRHNQTQHNRTKHDGTKTTRENTSPSDSTALCGQHTRAGSLHGSRVGRSEGRARCSGGGRPTWGRLAEEGMGKKHTAARANQSTLAVFRGGPVTPSQESPGSLPQLDFRKRPVILEPFGTWKRTLES